MQYHYFMDESGNTGSNWLDPNQPIAVHGGWLVESSLLSTFESSIDSLKEDNGSAESELKLSRLRGKRADSIIRDLFVAAISAGAIPVFFVSSKRFLAAAKLVETLLDTSYIPGAPLGFTSDFQTKAEIASHVMEHESLMSVLSGWLGGEDTVGTDEVRQAAGELQVLLRDVGLPTQASWLENLSEEVASTMGEDFIGSSMRRSVAFPGITGSVNLALAATRRVNAPLRVMHDRLVGLHEVSDFLNLMPGLVEFSEIDSRQSLGVQASDLLCGYVARLFRDALQATKLSDAQRTVLAQLVSLNEDLGFDSWGLNFSEQQLESIVLSFANTC